MSNEINHDVAHSRDSYGYQRRSGSSSNTWRRRSRILTIALVLALLVIFFLLLFFGTQLYTLNQENQELVFLLRTTQKELEQLQPIITELREDRKALVESRFPRLKPMEFEKVIELDQAYVKSIVFNRLNDGFEYKLITQNDSYYRVWPEIKIFYFNEVGIQIEGIQIGGPSEAPAAGESSSLAPDEGRSYPGTISLTGELPTYFMVVVAEDDIEHYDDGSLPAAE